ncbi:hypothetical protein OCU04_008286 [Sclerotinia nivalis]|uniref:Uncharacterized protein n=1 Tax=Sclerotinia nivalis TaxID=352851 RepID=A0A9X0AHR9_9HELO|nr:hypothetical protein OCU04_008286 [Sclerotinia nivalis]
MAHGWQKTMRRELHEKLDRSQEPFCLLYMVHTWLQLTVNLVVAGVAVGLRRKTSAGGIGVAFLNLVSLGESLTQTIQSWTAFETSHGAIARIEAFEQDTPVEPEITSPIDVSIQ